MRPTHTQRPCRTIYSSPRSPLRQCGSRPPHRPAPPARTHARVHRAPSHARAARCTLGFLFVWLKKWLFKRWPLNKCVNLINGLSKCHQVYTKLKEDISRSRQDGCGATLTNSDKAPNPSIPPPSTCVPSESGLVNNNPSHASPHRQAAEFRFRVCLPVSAAH